ncbi:hypothetical protein [Polymorphospora rubra]|uniref:hypothetical protein n=1 Tax=Polymorphospora rubra TaxID=338584 RepID=UPI001BB33104|nr:hypothetical protein [Polymorphospora rubra]
MSGIGSDVQYYWCTRHHRVETPSDKCADRYVLGPYPTRAAAEQAMQRVDERNAAWKAEDERWTGDDR